MQATTAKVLLAGLAPGMQLSEQNITSVTTDSRKIEKGSVFVAFPGEHFDGHTFAARAIEMGAAYVVVNHPVEGVPEEQMLVCPDSYRAMMTIGANYRAQFSPLLIGVTGSVGKTTTKEFCYSVLSAFGNTIKTEGNQNNELGLPNTLLRIDHTTEYGVVEMGMSHAGEISRLVRCAQPAAGIITCIGVSHMENLGSRENILKAKLEICEGLPEGAPLALNWDDEYLRSAHYPAHVRPVWFSLENPEADVYATDIQGNAENTLFVLEDMTYGSFAVTLPTIGRHNIRNALAAYCAATRLGLAAAKAAAALSHFEQTGMRQHVVKTKGVTVIEDCYNANPDSMRAALAMFENYPCKRRFALLGDMLELGEISEQAHAELGALAAQSNLYCLITYGPQAERTAITAAAKGQKTLYAHNYREAADALLSRVLPGDAILVKASRAIALEKVLELFYSEFPGKDGQEG
jgi:UDP-N-acetylmuramoyl-tripeptide--D-alanyl-D-alanine ligase